MTYARFALIALVAALHVYIAWFEIFAWTTRGPEVFSGFAPDLFEPTIPMAANQGVYNAFLAIGLIWSLTIRDAAWSDRVAVCFLTFVALAGGAAAITLSVRTGLPQMVPAVLALGAVFLNRRRTV